MVGETLGNYRLLQKIGEGGMGAVYLAEHVHLQRKAAVKLLLPEHSQRQELVDRFFNEAKLAASLNHPGIVEILDFGYDSRGAAYLVMAFIEGESLTKRLERQGPLSVPEAAEIGRQIALVVEAAHEQGIVHRDLKTDNVMLTPPQPGTAAGALVVKILDFGIAKLLGRGLSGASSKATSTGMILGTPLFMAPEQCRGAGTVDHRADIYSLGCILFMLLTGRPPFAYEGVGELLAAHLHETPPPPSSLRSDLPAWLDALVLSSLQKEPDARPQTMGAFAQALAAGRTGLQQAVVDPAAATAMRSAPTPDRTSTRVTTPEPTRSARAPTVETSRSRWRLVAGLVALGAAGAGIGLFVLRSRTTETNATPNAAARGAPEAAASRGGAENLDPAGGGGAVAELEPHENNTPDAAPDRASLSAEAAGPAPGEGAETSGAEAEGRRARIASAADGGASSPAAGPPTPRGSEAIAKEGSAGRAGPARERQPLPTAAERRNAEEANALYVRGMTALASRPVDALQTFRLYMQRTSGDSPQRLEVGRKLAELQRRFGELIVTCDVAGAQVLLNNIWVGATPLPQTIFVKPGRHVLEIRASGYRPWRQELTVGAGERVPIPVRVER